MTGGDAAHWATLAGRLLLVAASLGEYIVLSCMALMTGVLSLP